MKYTLPLIISFIICQFGYSQPSGLTPGTIGTSQTICYNTSPETLTEVTFPTGGTGEYTFQWQSSSDTIIWLDLPEDTLTEYTPPLLTESTYYRQGVISGLDTAYSNIVLVTVSPILTLAQLHDSQTIDENTFTNIHIDITGGTSPYTVSFTRNGVSQPTVTNYTSGTDISTGILTTGSYTYALTSVTDAGGCPAQSLGTGITLEVIQYVRVPVDSIFRTEVPVSSSHFTPYELGTEFQVLSDGYITKARLYSHVNEGGDHIVRLWELNGTTYTLAAGPFTWNFSPGLHGWRTYTLPSPVAVEANHTYIISISNSADRYFVISNNFSPSQHGAYLRYQRGVYTPTLGTVPKSTVNSCYFRDVVFAISGADTLTPGAIGTSQTICYNTAPVALTEITSPAGGTGSYAYQWQSSPDSTEWTDIPGATLSGYAPPALIANTYYRRGVMSGSLESVYSDPVLISISPLITLAQIYDNDTIDENTSTNLHVDITGSTAPYVINYTRNGVSQSAISNYASGTNISTGILTAGSYNYSLTSVTDAGGCPAQNLGTGITLEVIQYVRVPVDSIFRTEVPVSSSHFTPYELGTEFQVLSDGYITKARLYSHVNEGGDHIVRLWELNGTTYTLAAGPFTWNFSPGLHGWRTYTLPSPVAVEANHTYIISISNSADRYFVISNNFSPSQHGAYLRYQRGVYTPTLGTVPKSTVNSCYFRDVVFAISGADTLTPGAIGTSQTICYNTAPVALTEITSPAGGTGSYAYQWQSSPDSTEWTDIPGATLSGYAPPALIANTYYRRGVMSGSLESVYSDPVLISISPLITLAQIYDNDTIDENTSTNLHVDITGSTAPYVINYTRNGVSQSAISNYASGTNISTGILTAGSYNYSLTSVTDAGGCPAQNLGTGITLEVIQYVRVPVDSIFRTEVPVSSSHFTPYELGTEFQVLSDGYITKARLYSHVNEGGDHIVRLWELNGTTYTLAAGPFTWNFSPGLHGWRTYTLPSPVAVEANHTYIISISNSADRYFVISNNFSPSQHGAYLRYQRGVYTPTLGTVPKSTVNSCYFRDVVFAISGADTLTPGAIGTSQTICYNTAPVALTEITSPAGGTGSYAYQWQSSPDSTEWTDIPGATLSGYAPPALIANTYYRRGVMSGSLESVYSDPVLISISPLITLAQIYDNDTIDENTSTNLHVDITGSTAPYVINYTRNGVSQSAISNYASGTNISTGILTAGSYNYSLTSVTDAGGCPAQNLGTGITLEVIQYVRVPVDSIFRTEVPVSSSHFTPYELGTEFQVLSDGYITKARLYSHVNEGGDHIVRLWELNGTTYTLAAGPFTWNFSPGLHGWRTYTLPSPVAVEANHTYIISISNSADRYFVISNNFSPSQHGAYLRYQRGVYTPTLGTVPKSTVNSCYFRDVVFAISGADTLTPGAIGTSQTICYNTAPSSLIEITAPTGGTGSYTYQWQSSTDSISWTDIPGATLSGYAPGALTESIYYRRGVMSGNLDTVYSNVIPISVSPQFTLSQLYQSDTIVSNISTNIHIDITGGTAPYSINYTRNSVAQPAVNSYASGTNISTGLLTAGSYTYALTSVTDAFGCSTLNLGTEINITASLFVPVDSIFRAEIPDTSSSDGAYELGSEFQTLSNGYITKAKIYTHFNEGGNHTIRLWEFNGSTYTLAAGPFIWNIPAGVQGWREYSFTSPVLVVANQTYIISISNSSDYYYVKSTDVTFTQHGEHLRYVRGVYSDIPGAVPTLAVSSTYFRDVVFGFSGFDTLTPGTVGTNQTICYNTAPDTLSQITPPVGGTGVYAYQWQNSLDDSTWMNISGAILSNFAPSSLTQNTFYRRGVISGALDTVYSNPVLITVSPLVTLAQLHDSITIFNNTSAEFYVTITGGTSTFTINYTQNGVAQPAVTSYVSGTNISTDTLTTGGYTYALTSVTDVIGCTAQNLGTAIEVTVIDNGDLTAGSIGTSQTICYNTVPAPLTQVIAPMGGTGEYTYQWQSSPDSINWTNLSLDTLQDYAPPALMNTIYFRRMVMSDGFLPVSSNILKLAVSPQMPLAQLHDNSIIANNTSTVINVDITGGTSPYIINYTQNSIAQPTISNYINGTDISTGILTTGNYIYGLTSVTDALGCAPDSLGDSITISVINYFGVDSLFRTEIPDTSAYDGQYELGTEFRVLTNGFLSKALLYSSANEGGDHIIRLWELNGTAYSLLAGPFTWNLTSGLEGWREYIFTTPIIVHSNHTYIISISNGTDQYYTKTDNFVYVPHGQDLRYLRGVFSSVLDTVPLSTAYSSNYFRDVVFALSGFDTLTPGTIGTSQTICYNTTPSALTQLSAPVGGTGIYAYQWQNSLNDTLWMNIPGAIQSNFAPSSLTQNTYYRRAVVSGALDTVYSTSVLVAVSPPLTLAQLHDSITIFNNTSTEFQVIISGGTSPFTINYTQNGVSQPAVNNYVSGTNISTDTLTTGGYTYALTSVTDVAGCPAQNLGTAIEVTVIDNGDLTAGSIGTAQTICYNTLPAPLTQIIAPTGGTGDYTYQWQSSPDSIIWTDLSVDTLPDYAPPALMNTTYFRRIVMSGGYLPVNSNIIKLTASPQIPLAQLHDNSIIANNTSTVIHIDITGGTSPYIINYTQNSIAQPTISDYISGTNVSTGVLTTGNYIYELTSVTDVLGCVPDSLGDSIIVSVVDYTPVDSLFRSEIPYTSSSDAQYELGSEFQVFSNGYLLKAKLFSHINEEGVHIIRVWRFNGTTYDLFAGPYTWDLTAGISGWRTFTFPTPVAVEAGEVYIISITNGSDLNYMHTENFQSSAPGVYVNFIRGLYSPVIGNVPDLEYLGTNYFRDIVFGVQVGNGNLMAGTIGYAQNLCQDSLPETLTQLTAPSGGTGVYTFQWQSSPNNVVWTDISGATQQDYTPSTVLSSTYFRRVVTSGNYIPVNGAPIQISISPPITLAQLHDSISIANNTSTFFNVTISGGVSPYTFDYTRNFVLQDTVKNYFSGTSVGTGILTTGDYTYQLTSLTDAYGCETDNLGTPITINVSDSNGIVLNSNKALVLFNSTSAYYSDFELYVKAYLDNFGIPYDTLDVSTTSLPDFNNYAIIIFSHNEVYESGYPITELEQAISGGVGLYSFDSHLFDEVNSLSTPIIPRIVESDKIQIDNTTHFITELHVPDEFNPSNDTIPINGSFEITQNNTLNGGISLASLSFSGNNASLLEVSSFGNGRVVKWNAYDWLYDWFVGPIKGIDDIVWRSIVWAARKPFVMQGLPPMFTMRVDDVRGTGLGIIDNFRWVDICNEFGIIPWCGTFNDNISPEHILKLKSLLDNNLATAFPHGFGNGRFIYFNHNNLENFDVVQTIDEAWDFYIQNGLKLSNYLVPHYYEVSYDALPEIHAMGADFIATHMLPDNYYNSGQPWIHCGPYRIGRNGPSNQARPVYYGGSITLNGIEFFICLSEIRDDGGYEWFPDNNITTTVARGIRHLRRSLNSMALASLFTHEIYLQDISEPDFREILRQITESISEYNPEYTSTDYAVKYIRAKTKIKITNVVETLNNMEITYSGTNDMDTKCMLFSEDNGQITSRYVDLPQVNGIHVVTVIKQ